MRGARVWFALQAVAGALWWVSVFADDDVRRRTLGPVPVLPMFAADAVLFVAASAVAAWWPSRRSGRSAAWVVAAWATVVTIVMLVVALVSRHGGWGAVLMAPSAAGSIVAACLLQWQRLPSERVLFGPFAFRPAPERSTATNVRRSLVQLVVFWSAFFLVVPVLVVAIERRIGVAWPALDRRAVRMVGIVVLAAGSAVGLWSCLSMSRFGGGTPLPAAMANRLVVAGPYRWIRNPMATAGAAQTAAVGLLFGSWGVVALAAAGAVAWNFVVRPAEEHDLEQRFGDDFRRYRAAVPCWRPARRPERWVRQA